MGAGDKAAIETRYEVHVAGVVPDHELTAQVAGLGEAEAVGHETCTVLSCTFADQAALHGFLHRLWAHRLQVVGVRRARRPG